MRFIAGQQARELKAFLRRSLKGPVAMHLWVRQRFSPSQQVLEELTRLSPRMSLEISTVGPDEEAAHPQLPELTVEGSGRGTLRFVGPFSGPELKILLQELSEVSAGWSSLPPFARRALRRLGRKVHLRVFVGAGCPFCPAAARLAHQMALESEAVTADVVDVASFPALASQFGVRVVPTTIINDEVSLPGVQTAAQLLLVFRILGMRMGSHPRKGWRHVAEPRVTP